MYAYLRQVLKEILTNSIATRCPTIRGFNRIRYRSEFNKLGRSSDYDVFTIIDSVSTVANDVYNYKISCR